ncbi:hypothetical protein [Streptomyces sp. DSM 40750]|uniref:hypothetical protein n=1 Tax=Streptomyces sp. DSM 40750 TaxID=2801030 RepID=UPI00214BC942|nr:hypothetical protein [Streptomyces sp. DSM 40750]UUU25232.1 hypothetical protein JIX55_36040 [Streptomyces sp. DSM 40750]
MEIRSARGGGIAVRWAYGVFLTLFVALAVLVHHETSATGVPPMPSAAHAVMPSTPHAAHAMPDESAPAVLDHSSHSADGNGGCSSPGTQHCATGNVASVQLAVPAQVAYDPLVNLRHALAGHAPAATVGRVPPDLSVLSQLRI